ncbi:hypothetical protein JQN37_23750, partial [Escherichia coli]|nr:hypothetical protein [Escherichia coli]
NKSYKKSPRVVGDGIGKNHPHGDSAGYATIGCLAQAFSLGFMEVYCTGEYCFLCTFDASDDTP